MGRFGRSALVVAAAVLCGCLHSWEVSCWHHGLNNLSVPEQKVVGLKTENAFYYSFYEEVVSAPTLSEALDCVLRDERSEAPDTINAIQRFNIYQEVLCGLLYRLLRASCCSEWLPDPWYFFRGCSYALQGFGHVCLALLVACLGGGGLLGGVVPIVVQYCLLFLHRKDMSRIWDVGMLNLRENWAMPMIYWQVLSLLRLISSHPAMRAGTRCKEYVWWLWSFRISTVVCVLLWQFSAFAFMLQVAAVFLCSLLANALYARRVVQDVVTSHLLGIVVCVILLFGNDLLMHHMLVTECIAIWAVLRWRPRPPSRWLLWWVDGALAVALFAALRVFQSRWATAEEHIAEIFIAKARKLYPSMLSSEQSEPSFNARLYFAVSVFDFIDWGQIAVGRPTLVYHFAALAAVLWTLAFAGSVYFASDERVESGGQCSGSGSGAAHTVKGAGGASALRQRRGGARDGAAAAGGGKSIAAAAAAARGRPWSGTLKKTLKDRVPDVEGAAGFRELRRVLVEDYGGIAAVREELTSEGFLDARGRLTTGTQPFNLFARCAAGEMVQPGIEVEQPLLGEFQEDYMICCNRPENDDHWSSEDPEWVGKASMCKRHKFLTTKDLHIEWFNVLTFGLVEEQDGAVGLREALEQAQRMKRAALTYARAASGWSKDVGVFVHVFGHNSVNSLHLHILDMKDLGPGYFKHKHKNCPIDAVIQVLREELESSTGHGLGPPVSAAAADAFGYAVFLVQTVLWLALGCFISRLKVLGAPLLVAAASAASAPAGLSAALSRTMLSGARGRGGLATVRTMLFFALALIQLGQLVFLAGLLPFMEERGLNSHTEHQWMDGERAELYEWVTRNLPAVSTVVTSMPLSAELRLNSPVRIVVHPQFEAKHLRDRVQELYEFYMCTPPERLVASMRKYTATHIVLEYKRCDFSPFLLDNHPEFNCQKGERPWHDLFCPAAHVSPHFDLLFANAGFAVFKLQDAAAAGHRAAASIDQAGAWGAMLQRCLAESPGECPSRIAELGVVFDSKLGQRQVARLLLDWADARGKDDAMVQFIMGNHLDYNLQQESKAAARYRRAYELAPNSGIIGREYLMWLDVVAKDNRSTEAMLRPRRHSRGDRKSLLEVGSVAFACEAAVSAKDLFRDWEWAEDLWNFAVRESIGHRCVKTNWPLFNNNENMEDTLGAWGIFANIFWHRRCRSELASMSQIAGVRFEHPRPTWNFTLAAAFGARGHRRG